MKPKTPEKVKQLEKNWNPSRSFLEELAEALGVSPANPTAVEIAL